MKIDNSKYKSLIEQQKGKSDQAISTEHKILKNALIAMQEMALSDEDKAAVQMAIEEYEELERLAEIGRKTEILNERIFYFKNNNEEQEDGNDGSTKG